MAIEQEIRNAGGMSGTLAAGAINVQRSYITSPEVLQWVKEGRVFSALHGTITTPVALANASIVSLQPELTLRVPQSTIIIPLMVQVVIEATITLSISELLIRVTDGDFGSGTSTAVTPTQTNMKYGGKLSGVTAARSYTANGTMGTNVAELFRGIMSQDTDAATSGIPIPPQHWVWLPLNGYGVPTMVGSPSGYNSLLVNLGGGASLPSVFINAVWAEFTHAEVYGS